MPRNARKARRLVADGHTYLWTLRHRHDDGTCLQILTLHSDRGGSLRIVFAEAPDRYVPGGAPLGAGDVGRVEGASLNLHEPGAVRALLNVATARGWRPSDRRRAEMDGWPLLEEAAAVREGNTGGAPHHVHEAGSGACPGSGTA